MDGLGGRELTGILAQRFLQAWLLFRDNVLSFFTEAEFITGFDAQVLTDAGSDIASLAAQWIDEGSVQAQRAHRWCRRGVTRFALLWQSARRDRRRSRYTHEPSFGARCHRKVSRAQNQATGRVWAFCAHTPLAGCCPACNTRSKS